MPISNLIIEAADYEGHDVDSLSYKPSEDGIDADTLQKRFDAPAKEVVGPALNALITALGSGAAGDSGAANIGVAPISTVAYASVQAVLESFQTQIDNVNADKVSLGYDSVADSQLKQDTGSLLARFAAHALDFASHFHYLGTTGGTVTSYTASDAGFTFDQTKVNFLAVRAHADCGASPTLNVNSAGAMTIRPNGGSALAAAQMKLNGVYLMMWYPASPSVLHILNPETVTLELTIGNVTGLTAALGGKAQSAHTHTQGDVTGLTAALDGKVANSFTASRALVSSTDGKVSAHSSTTAAEIGCLSGVTASVQGQFNSVQSQFTSVASQLSGKAASAHDHSGSYLGLYAKATDSDRVDGHHVYVLGYDPGGADGDIWIQV